MLSRAKAGSLGDGGAGRNTMADGMSLVATNDGSGSLVLFWLTWIVSCAVAESAHKASRSIVCVLFIILNVLGAMSASNSRLCRFFVGICFLRH